MWDTAGEKLVSEVLLQTPSLGCTSVNRPRTYQSQLCSDTDCSLEDLLGAMYNWEEWRERERERERESGKSVLAARRDDDDDDDDDI